MTLCIAWLRSLGDAEELLIASDSRLRMGCAWDCGPKIMTLPRSDAAICFAGHTYDAYPLMIQMANAIASHPPSRSRAMDLCDMKGHTVRVFNHMRAQIHDLPNNQTTADPPDAYFILAGYSWRKQRFYIWRLHHDASIGKFTYSPVRLWSSVRGKKQIGFAGDYVPEAKERLIDLLRARKRLTVGGFDMEPFEVLRDMIRDGQHPHIGGPPQMVKIYRHMNVKPYAIYWPNREAGSLSLLGRPLLDYEVTQGLVLDPDTLVMEPCPASPQKTSDGQQDECTLSAGAAEA